MKELDIYKQTVKMIVFTVLSILICKLTKGYVLPLFVLAGVWCAISQKLGWALVFFVLMPFFVILNPAIFPKGASVVGLSLRAGPLLTGLCLAMGGMSRQGRHRLPFISMIPFLMAALISSSAGWAPKVSYLKWINFVMFLFGIWYGTQNLQYRPKDVFLLRSFFLAICAILVFGSVLVIPFPSISYATSLKTAIAEGGAELAGEVFEMMQLEGLKTLFCGITNQSQALAPLLVCVLAWVSCDMLFLERKFRLPHVVLIAFTFPLLYMTRSRVALVAGVFALGTVFFYTSRVIKLPMHIKQRLGSGMLFCLAFLAAAAVFSQIRSGTMSEWARKTNDSAADRRSLMEALTSSRMGLMDMSLRDFSRNPLFGMGFQVAEYTRDQTRGKGFVVSASIEKGVLPVMVLGEVGVLGALCFIVFIVSFFWNCSKRKYYVTITTFSVLLVTNMGEATFFSPGGVGGILWMMCCVGGFAIDTTILYRSQLQRQWAAMAQAQMEDEEQRRRQQGMSEGFDLYVRPRD